MNSFYKWMLVIVVCMACLFVAFGCGGDDDDDNNDTTGDDDDNNDDDNDDDNNDDNDTTTDDDDDDDDNDDDDTTILFADDFESHPLDAQPPAPWEVEVVENAAVLVNEFSGKEGNQAVKMYAGTMADRCSMIYTHDTPMSSGKISLTWDFYLLEDDYLDVSFQYELTGKPVCVGDFIMLNGGLLGFDGLNLQQVDCEVAFSTFQWYEGKLVFDLDKNKYSIFVDGAPTSCTDISATYIAVEEIQGFLAQIYGNNTGSLFIDNIRYAIVP